MSREELAGMIMSPESFDDGPPSCGPGSVYAARIADVILAAGYVKPRTVTSAEELDRLGFQAVVLDAYRLPYVCERHRTDGTRNEWKPCGMDYYIDLDDILFHGPATIVHEGES